MLQVKRRRVVVDDRPLASRIGERIRTARLSAGLTQLQLAGERYTKAYISALETGHTKPSVAALSYIADRLGLSAAYFLAGADPRRSRLEADLVLASGRWQEAADAYSSLLADARDGAVRAELLRNYAEALCRLGRGLEAIAPATEAVATFDDVHREGDSVLAGYWLAYAHYLAENTAEARSILRTCLDRVRGGTEVDPDLSVRLLTAAAYVETWDGKYQPAVAYLEEARALSTDLDDRRRAAFLSALASAYFDRGDIEGAVRAGSQSIVLFRAFEAQHEAALVANNLANAYLAVGNLARAAELAAEAHQQHERARDEHDLASVLDTEARIRLAAGDIAGSISLASRAVEVAGSSDNRKAQIDAQITIARASAQAGQAEAALEHYSNAAGQLREHGPDARLAVVLAEWAELEASRGAHEKAYQLSREALSRTIA